jgi:hypothetical protein
MKGYFLGKQLYPYFLITQIYFPISGFSQLPLGVYIASKDPYTINSNGGTLSINQLLLDWEISDLSNTLIYKNKQVLIVSTGFLQNAYDASTLYNSIEIFGEQIKVGPNPFTNRIGLFCKQDGMDILGIQVYDSHGILIRNIIGPFSGLQFEHTIQFQKLSNPICFVQIKYTVANRYTYYKTFKLIQN